MRKAIDYKDEIVKLYKELGNVWKVGEASGFSGQTIHENLTRWGVINKMNYFTKKDSDFLKLNYPKYRDGGKLKDLSELMNRTVPFLNRKAKALGLTNPDIHKFYGDKNKMSELMKARIKDEGHYKGMLGKKHSDVTKSTISKKGVLNWADKDSKFNSDEYRQLKSDNMMKFQAKNRANSINNYSRTKKGWWDNGTKRYFMRSSWEFKYADYLCLLEKANEIEKWEYESDTFYFEAIKRGTRSYTPDFKLFYSDGSIVYHEVKGWMDDKSKTKLKRMKKYHSGIKVIVIDKVKMKSLGLYKS